MLTLLPRPVDVPVNPTGQLIMVIGTALLALLALAGAVRLARRDRSPGPLVLLAAVAAGSILEPLYDNAFHILWYLPGQWRLYSALDVPQPAWIWLAFTGTYGSGALYAYARARAGVGPRQLVTPALLTIVGYVAFEVIGVNLGTYTYYGYHPFRLLEFPVWVTPINMAISFATGVAAALARRHLRGPGQWLAVALAFPLSFAGVAFGTGARAQRDQRGRQPADRRHGRRPDHARARRGHPLADEPAAAGLLPGRALRS